MATDPFATLFDDVVAVTEAERRRPEQIAARPLAGGARVRILRVPEPGQWALMAMGLAGLALLKRRSAV